MKLLYLYIEDHNCIKDQEFNFDSNYRFRLERKKSEKWELFKDEVENPLPDNFWVSSDGKHNVVESVSAIVGENGSGKTSIANFLGDCVGFDDIDTKYLVIFQRTKDSLPQCLTNIPNDKLNIINNINRIDDDNNPSLKHLPLIYYSPFFTTEHKFDPERTIDISTSSLLKLSNLKQYFANYKTEEYRKALAFLFRYYKIIKNHKKILMTMPEPRGIIISINIYDALIFSRYIIKNTDITGYNLDNLKTFLDDIHYEYGLISSNEEYKILFRESVTLVHKLANNDIFLGTFFCYIISFWRQYITSDSGKIINNHYFDDLKKSALEIVIDYFFCLSKVKLDKFHPQTYDEILDLVKSYDKEAFSFFESFKEFLSCPNIKIHKTINNSHKNWEIECDFSSFNEIKDKLLDLVFKYNKFNFKKEYIFWDFMPQISSGEMSFLTIYSRIYDCITNNVKDKKEFILFLDEVETTLHPEWQRKLVSQIITFLEKFAKNKKVHVIFASHSPILLSDIPDSNVVFLKKESGYAQVAKHESIGKTFGSNIYTLYKKSFFLDNGLMGNFSTEKLRIIFAELNNAIKLREEIYELNNSKETEKNRKEIEKKKKKFEKTIAHKENILNIISIIGEPLIREQLLRLASRVFTKNLDNNELRDFYIDQLKKLGIEVKVLQNMEQR